LGSKLLPWLFFTQTDAHLTFNDLVSVGKQAGYSYTALATAHSYTVFIPVALPTINVHAFTSYYTLKSLMHSSTLQHQTAQFDVSEHEGSVLPHGLVSGLTSQSNTVPTNGTSATAAAAAMGTTPSQQSAAAKFDPDNEDEDEDDTTSSEGEDPEITAMREEMIRYANRAPPGRPCHSNAVPQKPRPAPQPIAGVPKQRRAPPAVTLGPGTTANPKSTKSKSKSKK